jgi:hypothetical protein
MRAFLRVLLVVRGTLWEHYQHGRWKLVREVAEPSLHAWPAPALTCTGAMNFVGILLIRTFDWRATRGRDEFALRWHNRAFMADFGRTVAPSGPVATSQKQWRRRSQRVRAVWAVAASQR